MGDGAPRREFGRPRAALAKAFGVAAVGVALLAVVVVAWVWIGAYPPRLALLGVLGVPMTALGAYLLRTWLPAYRLTIGADGIELRHRRQTVLLPWTDLEYWWLGFPGAGGQKRGRLCVLAKPAPHVAAPDSGPRGSIWVQRWRRWLICEPQLTDEQSGEVVAAMRHFAGRLEAHVVRANAPAGSAVHAVGEVDSDVHTSVGPTPIYPPKIVNAAVIGLLIAGFFTAMVVAGLPLAASFVFLPIIAVAVGAFAEAGYLFWHWRQQRTITVTADGVEVRTRRYAVTVPWQDVAYWTVGTGPRLSTTFFMGAKRAPNPAVRVPVRDVVLAVPAEHVRDGSLRQLWSSRHQAWEICKVTHTDATTGEIQALLRRFAPGKERDRRSGTPSGAPYRGR